MKTTIRLITILLSLVTASQAGSVVYHATPANYRSLINDLLPGDTLLLSAGTYTQGLPVSNLAGNANDSIIIRGPENGSPAIILGRSCCNTVQLTNTAYLTISHLTLDGQNIPYVDAVNTRGVNHHLTLEYLYIINHGGDGSDPDHQLTNGITAFGASWDWIIRHNTIIRAGTGMYIGNWQGNGSPFVGGLIEYNVFLDTLGYNTQFKQMNNRLDDNGNIPEGMPTEDRKTIIRHNVFSKANNAQFGAWARPSLLIGHYPLSGDGSNDVYEVYGNFFYENPADALFQGEGNIAFYNNIMVNSVGAGINIGPHNGLPRSINVFQNTVLTTGRGIAVNGGDNAYTQQILGNIVFANNAISTDAIAQNNFTDTYTNATNFLNSPFGAIGDLDLYPTNSSLTGTAIDAALLSAFTDWNMDFNSKLHTLEKRGAYAGFGVNMGWDLGLTTKDIDLIFANTFE